MLRRCIPLALGLALTLAVPAFAQEAAAASAPSADKAEKKPKPPKPPKVHSVVLGAAKRVPYNKEGDPAGASPTDKDLKVRPLLVDTRVKEWTAGDSHDVTDRSFVIRRALRVNDALPGDKAEHWVWQRGPWLLVDRTAGHITALHLPDYNPGVSDVSWFRDYAAYCGLSASGKQLYAVVAQVTARRPLVAKKLNAWDPLTHPSPACVPIAWQREPLKATFQPTGGDPATFDLAGTSAVLIEDADADDKDAKPE